MMSEEKEETQEEKEETVVEEEKPQTLLEKGESIAERIEEGNKQKEVLLEREEKLAFEKKLGGRSKAGDVPIKKTEEEKWAEDAKERYSGMGLDPTDDDTPITYS